MPLYYALPTIIIVFLQLISAVCASKERLEDEELYSLAIERPESQIETVAGTTKLMQAFSFLSFIASILIISISLRSRGGLRRQINRFTFILGVGEFLSSFAACFVTWPMPVDSIYSQSDGAVYQYYGNFSTCTVQGVFFIFGRSISVCFMMALCIYYAHIAEHCFLSRRSQRLEGMSKNREIILMSFCFCFAATFSIECTRLNMLNPDFTRSICSLNTYPTYCRFKYDEYEECSKEEADSFRTLKIYGLSMSALATSISVLSMISICSATFAQKREMSIGMHRLFNGRQLTRRTSNQVETTEAIMRQIQNLNIIVMLSAGYLFLLVTGQLFVCVSYLLQIHEIKWVHYFITTALSTRGVFLSILVLVDKACNHRRQNSDLSFWGAMCEVFQCPQNEPLYYISNLALIEDSQDSDDPPPPIDRNLDELVNNHTEDIKTFALDSEKDSSALGLSRDDISSSFDLSHQDISVREFGGGSIRDDK